MNDLLQQEWMWRDFGNGYQLYTRRGGAKVVLAADRSGQLMARDKDGVLEPITPDHPVARAIGAVPALLRALEEIRDRTDVRRIEDSVTVTDGVHRTASAALAVAKGAET